MIIIGNLPNNLTNGTTADATQVMADFNAIVNSVNANAAAITTVQNGQYNYAADSGTVNNIVVGMTPSPSVYTDGIQGNFKAANTNTSTTVNIKYGGLGNKSLVIDAAGTLPPIGSIVSGMHYRTEYDSTQDKVILLNPSTSVGSFTLTLKENSGATTLATGTVNYAVLPDGKEAFISNRANISAVSAATDMTGTGVPAILTAASSGHRLMVAGENATSVQVIFLNNLNLTTWTFTTFAGAFTASGTKGFLACDVSCELR